MREPPADPDDARVLALVRAHWSREVDAVEHLPVGFGAHHWRATTRGRPVSFVTHDVLAAPGGPSHPGPHHTAASLEAAYAAAAELVFALDFVVAGLPTAAGRWTVPVAAGALSVTPWVHGETRDTADEQVTSRILERLHAAHPPRGLPRWQPMVAPGLADDVAARLERPWTAGPHGEEARAVLAEHLPDLRSWARRHHHLAGLAATRPWVVTHGEPHHRNQLVTTVRTLLVDWESVRLAPRERDLRTLGAEALAAAGPDPEMVELFDLEWRLDEIGQYAAWFEAPHTGTADDEIALAGLRFELSRP